MDIDQEVATWNAALAKGDPVVIAETRRTVLASLARAAMDDDPHYAIAGWTVGQADI